MDKNFIFERLAVSMGFVSKEQAQEGIQVCKAFPQMTLDQILRERGWLTIEQSKLVFERVDKVVAKIEDENANLMDSELENEPTSEKKPEEVSEEVFRKVEKMQDLGTIRMTVPSKNDPSPVADVSQKDTGLDIGAFLESWAAEEEPPSLPNTPLKVEESESSDSGDSLDIDSHTRKKLEAMQDFNTMRIEPTKKTVSPSVVKPVLSQPPNTPTEGIVIDWEESSGDAPKTVSQIDSSPVSPQSCEISPQSCEISPENSAYMDTNVRKKLESMQDFNTMRIPPSQPSDPTKEIHNKVRRVQNLPTQRIESSRKPTNRITDEFDMLASEEQPLLEDMLLGSESEESFSLDLGESSQEDTESNEAEKRAKMAESLPTEEADSTLKSKGLPQGIVNKDIQEQVKKIQDFSTIRISVEDLKKKNNK